MASHADIPLVYRLVFLWFEPAAILAGALLAFFRPRDYLDLTFPAGHAALSTPVSVVMMQLANLYLGLALLEAAVLRATADVHVWRIFMIALLVADGGHVFSVHPVGPPSIYWACWKWNAMDWGNLGIVYFLATTRLFLLFRVGAGPATTARKKV